MYLYFYEGTQGQTAEVVINKLGILILAEL